MKKKHTLINKTDNTLIVYIPDEYVFNNVSIESGAGKVEIDNINTKKIELFLGAGKVEINNLNVFEETEIEGGAGEILIKNGNISNLDLDMGLGKLKLTSSLNGINNIDAGIGELEINLNKNLDDYKIKMLLFTA